jgi:hypothetical protein
MAIMHGLDGQQTHRTPGNGQQFTVEEIAELMGIPHPQRVQYAVGDVPVTFWFYHQGDTTQPVNEHLQRGMGLMTPFRGPVLQVPICEAPTEA